MQSKLVRVAVAIGATLLLVACAEIPVDSDTSRDPARVTPVPGSDLSSMVLIPSAVRRLGIETTAVENAALQGTAIQRVVPYSAVVYDAKGATWTYTSPAARTFVRAPITVDRID